MLINQSGHLLQQLQHHLQTALLQVWTCCFFQQCLGASQSGGGCNHAPPPPLYHLQFLLLAHLCKSRGAKVLQQWEMILSVQNHSDTFANKCKFGIYMIFCMLFLSALFYSSSLLCNSSGSVVKWCFSYVVSSRKLIQFSRLHARHLMTNIFCSICRLDPFFSFVFLYISHRCAEVLKTSNDYSVVYIEKWFCHRNMGHCTWWNWWSCWTNYLFLTVASRRDIREKV